MIRQNSFLVATRMVALDVIMEALYAPVWWYTAGLRHIALNRLKNMRDTASHLALRLLILNIFQPMFAQFDRAGRIISFFMRIIIIIARLVYFLVYCIFELAILALWVAVPLFVLYRLIVLYV